MAKWRVTRGERFLIAKGACEDMLRAYRKRRAEGKSDSEIYNSWPRHSPLRWLLYQLYPLADSTQARKIMLSRYGVFDLGGFRWRNPSEIRKILPWSEINSMLARWARKHPQRRKKKRSA